MKKISITTSSFAEFENTPMQLLEAEGIQVAKNSLHRKLNEEELIGLAQGCVGIIAGTETYTREVLQRFLGLKVISRCGTGLDNIDMVAADALGIMVYNTPDAPTEAVAELTIGLILALFRNIPLMDSELRQGIWKKRMGLLLAGKKIGIIGFGRIGQRVAELLKAFRAEIAYYDIVPKCISGYSQKKLADLLSWSDIVTIHCAASPGGEPILNRAELLKMKKGGWLINAARPEIIDENSLLKVLEEGHLAGAALDVFSEEPYKGELLKSHKVVLTPHIGSYAREARVNMEINSVENLIKGLKKAGCI